MCASPGSCGQPFSPRSSLQGSPAGSAPQAALTPGLKNAEGCWWGKLIGNRKAWHSFPAGLGLEGSEGLPFPLSRPAGERGGEHGYLALVFSESPRQSPRHPHLVGTRTVT